MQPAATSTMKCIEAEPNLITIEYTLTFEGMNDLLIQPQGDRRGPSNLLGSRQLSHFHLAKLHNKRSHTAVTVCCELSQRSGGYLTNNDRTRPNIPIKASAVAIRD